MAAHVEPVEMDKDPQQVFYLFVDNSAAVEPKGVPKNP
jgi:hypothetical protein